MNGFARGRRVTTAFTLLEVLLTLSMSVVLMMLVGGAMRFYAHDMNIRDLDIRQTLLATAVMQMIEDDLRATLHTEPMDMSGLESLLASAAGSGADTAPVERDTEGTSPADRASSDATTSEASTAETLTVDSDSGAVMLQAPGLIGNQFQIQVDISRLPRLEEYVAMFDGSSGDIDDIPSDLKTVSYFVQPAGVIAGVRDALESLDPEASGQTSGGLVRRSLDRAVTLQAAATGGLSLLSQTGEILAPEVLAVEFQYWDGATWQLQWDSDECGELPLAVKVQLTMSDPTSSAEIAEGGDPATRTFTHIVRLPLARPVDTSDDDLSEAGP